MLKKEKQSCGQCGFSYEAKPRRNGRKWKIKVEDTVYLCTPYATVCPKCKCKNSWDFSEKAK